MVRRLPVRPNLTHLRNEAKAALRDHRGKDIACCGFLRGLKHLAGASDAQVLAAELTLTDVQHALAINYGYPSWAKLKARVEHSAPPMQVAPPARWYHGSSRALDTLREGSAVTPILELARAFAHRPSRVDINIREEDMAPSRSVVIEHDGTQGGFLYEVTVADPAADLRPHPESTMAPGEEMPDDAGIAAGVVGVAGGRRFGPTGVCGHDGNTSPGPARGPQ